MNIGAVNFLNAFPLWWGLENQPGIKLVKDIPSKLADALIRGELDAAIISSIEYFRNRDILDYHPELCISARGRVESIRLFRSHSDNQMDIIDWFKRPQSEFIFFYDRATRSSLAMLQVICRELGLGNARFYKFEGDFENKIQDLVSNEALLLIGDPALKFRHTPSVDLGEVYFRIFGRAFVYAIWVFRRDSDGSMKQILMNAYEKGVENYQELLNESIRLFQFPKDFTDQYLQSIIQYRMTDQLREDMEFFFDKSRQLH